jgi:methanogenic corrinoid protein MtbC1
MKPRHIFKENISMDFEKINVRYLENLLKGDRNGCREVLGQALQTGTPVNTVYTELFWPVMKIVESLFRENRIDTITEKIATRINRTLVDQLQSKLPKRENRNKSIVVVCADDEPEELGAQMCADLFESDGWNVRFIGGGVPNDEIMVLCGKMQPDVLFLYGTKPSGAPAVRQLIDGVRLVGSCPEMKIMLSGGIFNRAEGLWEEIGADLFAPTAKEALEMSLTKPLPSQATVKRRRRTLPKIVLPIEDAVQA